MKALRCGVKYFCLGSFLIFTGSVLLCALGITVVLPYKITKDWVKVICVSTGGRYNNSMCACEQELMMRNCHEVYPCLRVSVLYNRTTRTVRVDTTGMQTTDLKSHYSQSPSPHPTKPGCGSQGNDSVQVCNDTDSTESLHNSRKNAHGASKSAPTVVAEQDAILYRSWSDAFYQTCSLHECDDQQWNIKQAQQFRQHWGRHDFTFPCYYDPDQPRTTVLSVTSLSQMIHAVVWPSLCLLAGTTMWMGLYFGCWVIKSDEPTAFPRRFEIAAI